MRPLVYALLVAAIFALTGFNWWVGAGAAGMACWAMVRR